MNALDLTLSVWPMLVRGTMQGSVALLAAFLVCRFVPGLPAWGKSWLWRLASLRVMLAFVTGATVPLAILPAAQPVVTRLTAPAVTIAREPNVEIPLVSPTEARGFGGRIVSREDFLVTIWAMGTFAMLVRLGFHFRAAKRLRRTAIVCEDVVAVARLRELSDEMKIHCPALQVSSRITKPLLTGIFRPAVMLPAEVRFGDGRHLDLIFRHELAHLKRRDLGWNLVSAIGHALLWFNPLSWVSERESHFTQEIACDELALRGAKGSAHEFANLLIDIAARRERGPQLATVGMIRAANTLERRLKAMKTIHRKGARQIVATCVVALALTPALIPWRAVAQKSEAKSAVENDSAALPAAEVGKISEEDLLEQEIKLARSELDSIQRSRDNGVISEEEVIRKKREVRKLERELAASRDDISKFRELMQQEIKDVEKLQAAAANRIKSGVGSQEEKSKIDREVLHLKRELAMLDRPSNGSTNGAAAGDMSMMYYMSNPELMKRYFPQMYARMMKNGGTNIGTGAMGQPENSQESFQRRLSRASAERPHVRLQVKRPGVVIQTAVKRGDQVSEGQVLVRLDDRDARIRFRIAHSEYEIAEADHLLKRRELENGFKFRQSSDKNASDETKQSHQEEYDLKLKRLDSEFELAKIKLEQAELELESFTIKAPGDGIVANVASVGQSLTDASMAVEFLPDP